MVGTAAEQNADDEEMPLISFSNLEAVMKHMLGKFKSIEEKQEAFDKEQADMKRMLKNTVRIGALEGKLHEVQTHQEKMKEDLDERRNQVPSLAREVEVTAMKCKTLEGRLQTFAEEKTLHERLIADCRSM